MYRYPFAVGEQTYCVWEYDLPERNERFLSNLDPEYFGYIADLQASQLETEHRDRAAVALRAGYHHGSEALLSLLGALSQAPEAVPAWLPKCSTSTLRELTRQFLSGSPVLTQRGRQRLTFIDLSTVVHSVVWQDEEPPRTTATHFARFWERLAEDFLDEHNASEYNSIKHGFRVSSGGFYLRIGEEEGPGMPAAESEMQTVGGSPFGTTFFFPESVPTVKSPGNRSFRIRRLSLNWRAEAMVQRLQLIEFSLRNTIGALRIINGTDPTTVRFSRPSDPRAFEAPWQWDVGVSSANFDVIIDDQHCTPTESKALQAELEQRKPDGAV